MSKPILHGAIEENPRGQVRVYNADGKLLVGILCRGYLAELAKFSEQAKAEAWTRGLVDAVLSTGYRKPQQITTVDEMEVLPVGTVILDRDGMALQRTMWLGWVASNGSTNIDHEELERDCFPATVLHVGGSE